MDTEKQRQCRCNDARLTENGNTRRALEWIGMSKTWLVFRYEISHLFFYSLLIFQITIHLRAHEQPTVVMECV